MGEVIRISFENWLTLKALQESMRFLKDRNEPKDRVFLKRQKELFSYFQSEVA